MRTFPQLARSEVLHTLPMAQGWALYNWAIENDPWANTERDGKGYIAQQIKAQS